MECFGHEKTCQRPKRNVLVVEKPADGKNKAVSRTGNVSDAGNNAVSASGNVSFGSTALWVNNLRETTFLRPVLGGGCLFLTTCRVTPLVSSDIMAPPVCKSVVGKCWRPCLHNSTSRCYRAGCQRSGPTRPDPCWLRCCREPR
ncbi:MAG: hypothetical protein JWM68_4322 [Verrucomicrobiales bacterium]|nr:hypothetical protein [Verrucomicrobiales bacterium]